MWVWYRVGTWLISTRAKTVIGVDQCAEAIAEAQSNFSGHFLCLKHGGRGLR
jgi:hypothetical protein